MGGCTRELSLAEKLDHTCSHLGETTSEMHDLNEMSLGIFNREGLKSELLNFKKII